MSLFNLSVNFYRKTIKQFHPAHVATHRMMTRWVIPTLERSKQFQTIPDDPFWFRLELLTGRHEVETAQQVDRLVRPGMTVLDVGAHVGYYARRLAQLVGEDGRVFAFEPHPRTFAVLEHNVGEWPQVTAVPLAAAETEGTAELHDYLIMSASGSLHYDQSLAELQRSRQSASDIAPRLGQNLADRTFTVRTAPLDAYLAEVGITQVDFVKMDIEGAEMGALRGMRRTIEHSPRLTLVMEYNPQALQAFGFEPTAALAEVLALGFGRVQAIEADGRLTDLTDDLAAVKTRTEQLKAEMGVVNLLFTR